MPKTNIEMADDILSSLRMKNAPERILIEAYLDTMIKQHRNDAIKQYIERYEITEEKKD